MVNGASQHPAALTREAAHWHALQREAALSAEQRRQFMAWLVTSPAHLREYLAVSRTAGELGEAMRGMSLDVDALLARSGEDTMRANVVPLRPTQPARAVPVATTVPAAPARRRWLPRVAAAAGVVLCVGVAVQMALPQSRHHVAAHGAPRSITLPDGTLLRLNAESEVAVRYGLFQRRVELLRGQASFEVAEERRRFAVHAAGLEVQDIGTTFDVALHRDQARIGVSEGRVRVFGEAGDGALLADLQAGQSARVAYRDRAVQIREQSADSMTAWWQRRIVFQDEPLFEVAEQFNRLSRVRLQVDDDAAGALRLTGNLRGEDIESLRVFLDQQPSLATQRIGNRIQVRTRAPHSVPAVHPARHR